MHKIFERFLPAALRGPRAESAGPVPAPYVRVGCDVAAISDVQWALDRFGDRYLTRVFGLSGPLSRYELSPQHLAGKFAAMEAVAKILDVRATSVPLGDIEIVNNPSGRPSVVLHRRASEVARALGVQAWDVSISHEADTAFAVAVATGLAGRGGQTQETQSSQFRQV
ncbi:holo-ACP synthase [Corynebacterium sanguinis]|uniref:holo-ACP synthase n=1 Tax=Corynebacterium sanguinis TaxID=2594913 RepID=UPI00223C3E55|nr:holo-ACP synthase [Corynebacterium sanguinis]MCT1598371.1 holo-ACP synthase [Corynebacterium sanguinis]MCT1629414.1 holo-ACP synthase [Corynebacterium sanguinis]